MAFIGKGRGFCQRHFPQTKSYYCPNWAIENAGDLVRSPVNLDLIREDVRLFNRACVARFSDPLLDKVISDAFYKFSLPQKVNPIHLNDIPKLQLENWGSSPGLPWKEYGYASKRDVANDHKAFNNIRKFWHLIKEGKKISPPDCAAYVRPHLAQRGEVKVRAVWGYPATISFQEACFALPLINEYKKGKHPMAYSFETARGGCRKLFHRFHPHRNFLSSDYSKFDKTIPSWLIYVCFDILLANIDYRYYQQEGQPNCEKLYRAWRFIVHYFINTPIRLCNGERFRKKSGIASGSYFTQLIGSIANWIVTQYCIREQGNKVLDHLVLGDDSLVAMAKRLDIDRFVRTARLFGMIINADKTQTADRIHDIKFLGYHINNGNPTRPQKELCAALAYPERPDQDFSEFATRALGLLIANFGHNIQFDNCCRSILEVEHKTRYTPSLVRYLRVLGIEELPKKPPDLTTLLLWRYRT
uniref:RdRp n=1 Tax=Hubei partiti-like virus 29 TaxID=1923036 RepID=A0A1L3KLI9_9VIRU|nr:RdRp [Hubei partiti-like virus 29]